MISKNHVKYIQSLHSKKNRDEASLFIVEGVKIVLEFLKSDSCFVVEVLALPVFIKENEVLLIEKNITFSEITEDELKKISLQNSPNKVLALVRIPKEIIPKKDSINDVCLFLDDIRDPGNLGTIIRIADWFGITHVFCSNDSTDLYNPKTIQASMGAVLRVTVIFINFENLIANQPHLPIYGALLNGDNIYTTSLKKGIIIIGNEANGISSSILKHIKYPITIPCASINGSESLNAANACAIICSEFHRQLTYK